MKQKIHKFWIWLFGSLKYRPISHLDLICMFFKSRYRLFIYKRIFWDHCEENLHPCFLIDREFFLTSTKNKRFGILQDFTQEERLPTERL
jgi:hypothetical protein